MSAGAVRTGVDLVNAKAFVDGVRELSYHPSTNGGVERVNHTRAQMLSMGSSERQNNWDELLPHVESAFNISVNRADP